MKPKFKIGDTVILKGYTSIPFLGIVKSIPGNWHQRYSVRWSNLYIDTNGHTETQLEFAPHPLDVFKELINE